MTYVETPRVPTETICLVYPQHQTSGLQFKWNSTDLTKPISAVVLSILFRHRVGTTFENAFDQETSAGGPCAHMPHCRHRIAVPDRLNFLNICNFPKFTYLRANYLMLLPSVLSPSLQHPGSDKILGRTGSFGFERRVCRSQIRNARLLLHVHEVFL